MGMQSGSTQEGRRDRAKRVLVVDDHSTVRAGAKAVVERDGAFVVVGEAADGCAAIERTVSLEPDLVIMDIGLPLLNGIDATRQIRLLPKPPEIVALTVREDVDYVDAMFDAGAAGYVTKQCDQDELLVAMRSVVDGRAHVSARLPARSADRSAQKRPVLSERERQVLQLVAEGHTSRQIADRLHLSVKTIEACRQHMMSTLGIHGVAELTKYAVRCGLTPLDA
jgi:DNA-binding NarL/FixJ family response regulator